MEQEGLSEYELERQKKIAQNKAMLASLGLDKTILSSIVCALNVDGLLML